MRILWLSLLFIPVAHAGVIEIGATGNYRESYLTEKTYQKSVSYTGSISYYFWEMSALELSYTRGTNISSLKISTTDQQTINTTYFEMVGMDLVLTLADKQSYFLPYIKGGGAYLAKEMENQREGTPMQKDSLYGLVPSAGLGFKLRLSQNLSIKIGADAWTNPHKSGQDTVWDYAGRGGFSWLF